jgi:hypothetical protein
MRDSSASGTWPVNGRAFGGRGVDGFGKACCGTTTPSAVAAARDTDEVSRARRVRTVFMGGIDSTCVHQEVAKSESNVHSWNSRIAFVASHRARTSRDLLGTEQVRRFRFEGERLILDDDTQWG